MRIGKIARLPNEIREELNRRLGDSEPGSSLLPWLNGLRAVRTVLECQFGGASITKQNLSEWRTGGFLEWKARRELMADAGQFSVGAKELREAAGGKLTDDLATVLAAQYAVALRRWLAQPTQELEARLRVLHGLCGDIVALRRDDHFVVRMELERELLEFAREKAGVKARARVPELEDELRVGDGLGRNDGVEDRERRMEGGGDPAGKPAGAGAIEAQESNLVAPSRAEKNLRGSAGALEVNDAKLQSDAKPQNPEMFPRGPNICLFAERCESAAVANGSVENGILRLEQREVQPGPSWSNEQFFSARPQGAITDADGPQPFTTAGNPDSFARRRASLGHGGAGPVIFSDLVGSKRAPTGFLPFKKTLEKPVVAPLAGAR